MDFRQMMSENTSNKSESYFTGENEFLEESGVLLCANHAFLIEKYHNSRRNLDGVKTVEMVSFKNKELIFIEAKSSFSNPRNRELKFKEDIQSIVDKFIDSLILYCSVKEGIDPKISPERFPQISHKIVFLLVIREHKKEWGREIVQGIKEILPINIAKTWKPEVCVLNYDMAVKQEFAVKNA